MTLFEYLAIAFSLVFSFAAMRLVAGLAHASHPHSRYWVHLSAVCVLLLMTVSVFWVFWSFREVSWTLPRFLLVLGSPALLYFNACTIIPEDPSSIPSWRDYYYSVRRRYYSGILCWVLMTATISTLVLGMSWSHPARLVQLSVVLTGLVGATSSSERVHAGIAILATAFMLSVAGSVMTPPGALR